MKASNEGLFRNIDGNLLLELEVELASADEIRARSFGEVSNPTWTPVFQTWSPRPKSLFCPAIFGEPNARYRESAIATQCEVAGRQSGRGSGSTELLVSQSTYAVQEAVWQLFGSNAVDAVLGGDGKPMVTLSDRLERVRTRETLVPLFWALGLRARWDG
jgi:hypothetical protein